MLEQYIEKIAAEQNVKPRQVSSTIELLEEGSTVPFIARYRKEKTGSLDEVVITFIRDRLAQLIEVDKRKEAILKSIEEQGKLTPQLKTQIVNAQTLAILEDIYLPYKPKKRTRATIAKEKGLEPLAKLIFDQTGADVLEEAKKYIDPKKEVNSLEDAIAGAKDIIAEWVNENAQARTKLRNFFHENAVIISKVIKGKETEGAKFRDYFAWEESAKACPSHRMLAIRRGEKEKILTVKMLPKDEDALEILQEMFVKGKKSDAIIVKEAVADSYKRLLSISLETELRIDLKKKADETAVRIFGDNLRELLMAPPLGQKKVLAIDPGLRTGCKMVCLDAQGKLLINETVYLVGSDMQKTDGEEAIKKLLKKYAIEVIAVGNGTASRETEDFLKSFVDTKKIPVILVNESGASIYSASEVAREEFPDYDITVRGAVSIGRRLMDPLAELVKIDPKSIGVGQYQHDVDQNLLKRNLDDRVESCVNQVGVELNTASKQLLTYVSGLGPVRAQAIIDYRQKNGAFETRRQLFEVAGLGPKAIEQAAGFLRIHGAENPLDASAVHPESYEIVEKMAKDLDCSIKDLVEQKKLREKIDLNQYVSDIVGLPTLKDIISELDKPGRDPREPFVVFSYKEGIETIDHLTEGMKLPGVITNVTAFGAFVDIGVHQDGLVHISQLSDKFVKDPHSVVKVHQKVQVTVMSIDKERNRIALSMRQNPG